MTGLTCHLCCVWSAEHFFLCISVVVEMQEMQISLELYKSIREKERENTCKNRILFAEHLNTKILSSNAIPIFAVNNNLKKIRKNSK